MVIEMLKKQTIQQDFIEVKVRVPRTVYDFMNSFLKFTKADNNVEEAWGQIILDAVRELIKTYRIFDTPFNEKKRIIEKYGLQYWVGEYV